METTTRKRGRKSKGNRAVVQTRIPAELKPALDHAAEAAGLPLSDYLALLLAEHHGYPTPSWLQRDKNQEALPIGA